MWIRLWTVVCFVLLQLAHCEAFSVSDALPSSFSLELTINGSSLLLNLTRATDINADVPMFTLHNQNGKQHIAIERRKTNQTQEFAVYRDIDSGAVFAVVQSLDETGDVQTTFEGVIHTNGRVYDIRSKGVLRPKRQHFKDAFSNETEESVNGTVFFGDQWTQEVEFDVCTNILVGEDSVFTPDLKLNPDAVAQVTLQTHQKSSRRKRAVAQDVYIDVIALVDYAAYKYWYDISSGATETERQQNALESLRQYYAFVISGVDVLYKSADTYGSIGHSVHVRLTQILVATCGLSALWTERLRTAQDTVDGNQALIKLKDWAASTDLLLSYDHLMLFTGYDLTMPTAQGTSNGLLGVAWTGSACDTSGWATSVVEDLGGFNCIWTAAHELGHGLSADHDGSGNACNSNDRFIMAESLINSQTPQDLLNPWKFSQCSAQYFNDFFNVQLGTTRGTECLYGQLTVHADVPDVTSQMPGQVYDVDEQCQLIYGPDSFFCRGSLTDDTDVCLLRYCYEPASGNCYGEPAVRGTTCGNQMWCVGGECVYDANAPTIVGDCTFGDHKGEVGTTGMDCATILLSYPSACTQYAFMQTYCCDTCATAKRRKRNAVTSPPAPTAPASSVSLVNCSEIQGHPHLCYDNDTASQCCDDCYSVSNLSLTGCEFGDRNPSLCGCLNETLCQQSAYVEACCMTCTDVLLGNAPTSCPTIQTSSNPATVASTPSPTSVSITPSPAAASNNQNPNADPGNPGTPIPYPGAPGGQNPGNAPAPTTAGVVTTLPVTTIPPPGTTTPPPQPVTSPPPEPVTTTPPPQAITTLPPPPVTTIPVSVTTTPPPPAITIPPPPPVTTTPAPVTTTPASPPITTTPASPPVTTIPAPVMTTPPPPAVTTSPPPPVTAPSLVSTTPAPVTTPVQVTTPPVTTTPAPVTNPPPPTVMTTPPPPPVTAPPPVTTAPPPVTTASPPVTTVPPPVTTVPPPITTPPHAPVTTNSLAPPATTAPSSATITASVTVITTGTDDPNTAPITPAQMTNSPVPPGTTAEPESQYSEATDLFSFDSPYLVALVFGCPVLLVLSSALAVAIFCRKTNGVTPAKQAWI